MAERRNYKMNINIESYDNKEHDAKAKQAISNIKDNGLIPEVSDTYSVINIGSQSYFHTTVKGYTAIKLEGAHDNLKETIIRELINLNITEPEIHSIIQLYYLKYNINNIEALYPYLIEIMFDIIKIENELKHHMTDSLTNLLNTSIVPIKII